jgi:lipopolysaccharide export system protein LptA
VRKYLFTYILLLLAAAAMAQVKPVRRPAKSVVTIVSSTESRGIKMNGEDVFKVYNGVFRQETTTLSADSAYFYKSRNSFDAFGHVHINQSDTLDVYSDKLYYNGNSHVALLTNNVRMIDRDATLTTNYLTYNTATRIGTYTGGGKLVNKENTLVSQNGYYFALSRDAYFRYNVVLNTVDAVIKTDTLRYNSGSRISYFYGPTHIYGKDKDTLYTENGRYNTVNEQAFFGKRNRYSQKTKSLKGDSLFYDRLRGYGRAVKNVTFNDEEQKVTIKGDLGEYYRADERAVVTQNPYVILVTEQRDTSRKDSVVKAPVAKGRAGKNTAVRKAVPNTIPVKQNAATKTDASRASASTVDSLAIKPPPKIKRDTIYWGADTLETQIVTYKVLKELQEKMRLAGIKDTSLKVEAKTVAKKVPLQLSTSKNLILMPPAGIKMDMSFLHPDLFGAPKPRDTTKKQVATTLPKSKTDTSKTAVVKADVSKTDAGKATAEKAAATKVAPLAPPKVVRPDSVYLTRKVELSDTARIRILSAHHNAKIFKSDLQAKADSMFYSYADSTMRCYINPIFWTQGSQLSGDTIMLQLKNKKLDNMDLYPNAFTVNIEGVDSTHFNQVAGKKMRGFFADSKLYRMFVDGNAESIYFNRDSGKVTQMLRSIASRFRVNLKDNKISNLTKYTKIEDRIIPMDKAKDDDKILKGFIWKPKERPIAKESVTQASRYRPVIKPAAKPAAKPPAKGKPVAGKGTAAPAKGAPAKTAPNDSTRIKTAAPDTTGRKVIQPDPAHNTNKSDSIRLNRSPVDKTILQPPGSTVPVKIEREKVITDTLTKKPR